MADVRAQIAVEREGDRGAEGGVGLSQPAGSARALATSTMSAWGSRTLSPTSSCEASTVPFPLRNRPTLAAAVATAAGSRARSGVRPSAAHASRVPALRSTIRSSREPRSAPHRSDVRLAPHRAGARRRHGVAPGVAFSSASWRARGRISLCVRRRGRSSRRVALPATVHTRRADIVDRNDVVLATNYRQASVSPSPMEMIDPDGVARQLAHIFPDVDARDLFGQGCRTGANSSGSSAPSRPSSASG